MSLEQQLSYYRNRVEQQLDNVLPSTGSQPSRLHASMRYSALDAGKRVRPFLVYITGACLGAAENDLDRAACAVELIHSYSLIHDDLPSMDDDDLRRGKPTNHMAFDEATAILAGDALHTLAFEILAEPGGHGVSTRQQIDMVHTLAKASGSRGMGGGQAIDLAATGRALDLVELKEMHAMKTGCLICCSINLGIIAAPKVSDEIKLALNRYASAIGLAFQIKDDILDVESDTKTLGKPQGSDQLKGKATFPSLLGMSEAKRMTEQLVNDSVSALTIIPYDTQWLEQFAHYIIARSH